MPERTLTLTLDGNVPLREFGKAMHAFTGLVYALSSEVASAAKVDWTILDLQAGSASATVRGESERAEDVARVVTAYAVVGRSLAQRTRIPYSKNVATFARELTSVLDGRIPSLRFETDEEDVAVFADPRRQQDAVKHLTSYGAVEGRIQTLTNRTRLRFILYDTAEDKPISCYLQEGREEQMRDAWGRRAIVEGILSRDPETGRPVSIRRVQNIHFVQDSPPGSYREARGAVPRDPHAPTAEEAIRQLRDA
jgi:hypothetical protein